MQYSYNTPKSSPRRKRRSRSTAGQQNVPVRVIDVILDDTHPEWKKYGYSEAIGAIKYQEINKQVDISDPTSLPVAFPLVGDLKKLPLKNEIVLLTVAPGMNLSSTNLSSKKYYNTVVNLWNHPNHGAFPDNIDEELDLGDNIEELTDVNPLQPFPGDIILDGRQGQSIRLTGFASPKNILTDSNNNGKPLTIISNGQKFANTPYEPIIEDINEDASSIYLTSDHSIPLKQSHDLIENKSSYGFNKLPVLSQNYRGSQVILNGGRLFFNAKEEGIFLNSKLYIDLQSELINLNAIKEISLDAKTINLGEKTANAPSKLKEPVLLGHQTAAVLNEIKEILKTIGKALASAVDGEGRAVSTQVAGREIRGAIRTLGKKTSPFGSSPIKSKKVFTE